MKAKDRIMALIDLAGARGVTSSEIGNIAKVTPGTLYPVLFRWEKEGVVRSTWDEGASPRHRRYWLN